MTLIDFDFGFGHFNLDLFIKFNHISLHFFTTLYEDSSIDFGQDKTENTFNIPHDNCYMLNFFTSGHGQFITEHKTYEIRPGMFFLIPPNTDVLERVYYEDHPVKHTLFFNFKILGKSHLNKQEFIHQECADNIMEILTSNKIYFGYVPIYTPTSCFENLRCELNDESSGYISASSILALTILIIAVRSFLSGRKSELPIINHHVDKTMVHIRSFIRANLKTVTLQTLCEVTKFSRRQIQRLISKYFHKTYRQLLDEFRIKEAKRLIQENKLTLLQIASEIGYNDFRVFRRNFNKHTNIMPEHFLKHINTNT